MRKRFGKNYHLLHGRSWKHKQFQHTSTINSQSHNPMAVFFLLADSNLSRFRLLICQRCCLVDLKTFVADWTHQNAHPTHISWGIQWNFKLNGTLRLKDIRIHWQTPLMVRSGCCSFPLEIHGLFKGIQRKLSHNLPEHLKTAGFWGWFLHWPCTNKSLIDPCVHSCAPKTLRSISVCILIYNHLQSNAGSITSFGGIASHLGSVIHQWGR